MFMALKGPRPIRGARSLFDHRNTWYGASKERVAEGKWTALAEQRREQNKTARY
jgi:hypothetical protein